MSSQSARELLARLDLLGDQLRCYEPAPDATSDDEGCNWCGRSRNSHEDFTGACPSFAQETGKEALLPKC
jgi:hypothetical protein